MWRLYLLYITIDRRADIERGSGVTTTFALRQYYTNKESPLLTGPSAVHIGYSRINVTATETNPLNYNIWCACLGIYNVYVEDFMVRDVKFIWYNMSYRDLKKVLRSNKALRVFPLVDKPGKAERARVDF